MGTTFVCTQTATCMHGDSEKERSDKFTRTPKVHRRACSEVSVRTHMALGSDQWVGPGAGPISPGASGSTRRRGQAAVAHLRSSGAS